MVRIRDKLERIGEPNSSIDDSMSDCIRKSRPGMCIYVLDFPYIPQKIVDFALKICLSGPYFILSPLLPLSDLLGYLLQSL